MIAAALLPYVRANSFIGISDLSNLEIALRLSPVVATLIGAAIGFVVFAWNRNEARRRILTDVLRYFVRNYYFLDRCNTTRRTREALIRSFASEEDAAEAHARVEMMLQRYNDLLEKATEAHVNLEAEIAANSFRFNHHARQLLNAVSRAISGLGAAVNDGRFDAADIEIAKIRDLHGKLSAVARSLKVSRQIRSFLSRERTGDGVTESSDPLLAIPQRRMDVVMRLVHKRITDQAGNTFKVYAPKEVVENPGVLDAPDLVDRLKDKKFHVRFQDGTEERLLLVELLAFVYELVFIRHQETELLSKLNPAKLGVTHISITSTLKIAEITSPAVAKALLDKLVLSIDSPEVPISSQVPLSKSA